MTMNLLVVVLFGLFYFGRSFLQVHNPHYKIQLQAASEDPNFEAHLPTLLKVGRATERSSPDLANDLRKRFKEIEGVKRKAATLLKTKNAELAAELEELADELAETREHFVQTATWWDAWSRPSPDLPSELRAKAETEGGVGVKTDPNFVTHLPQFMKAGAADDRPAPDLPSELRMLKFKNMASLKRIAADTLRRSETQNSELAAELEEIADEIDESHDRFVKIAEELRANRKYYTGK